VWLGVSQDGVHVSGMDDSKLSGAMDPSGKYVISTRIRVGRNIRGFGLSPGIKRADRAAVEKLVRVRAWLLCCASAACGR
jgi:creatine kinase